MKKLFTLLLLPLFALTASAQAELLKLGLEGAQNRVH